MGDTWVHLRLCLTCGHVGCCDSSKNKHATKHFHATNHPIIQSFEPGEDWGWCYIDQLMLAMIPEQEEFPNWRRVPKWIDRSPLLQGMALQVSVVGRDGILQASNLDIDDRTRAGIDRKM